MRKLIVLLYHHSFVSSKQTPCTHFSCLWLEVKILDCWRNWSSVCKLNVLGENLLWCETHWLQYLVNFTHKNQRWKFRPHLCESGAWTFICASWIFSWILPLSAKHRTPGKAGHYLIMLIDMEKFNMQSQVYFQNSYYSDHVYDHIKQDTASSRWSSKVSFLVHGLIEFWKYMYSFAHFYVDLENL